MKKYNIKIKVGGTQDHPIFEDREVFGNSPVHARERLLIARMRRGLTTETVSIINA